MNKRSIIILTIARALETRGKNFSILEDNLQDNLQLSVQRLKSHHQMEEKE